MSAYENELERRCNELQQRLSQIEYDKNNSVPVRWVQAPLNKDRWDLYVGFKRTTRVSIATLVHDKTDIHKKGCFWRLALVSGETTFYESYEEACEYAIRTLHE